ncbi:uncharacterized protein LDX57_011927 [Aspergillus melleus]|uniref:uncharacterized protein n=1 Tax=Aspergillus melleus TaxID=138277 RepID=UPI001E8EAFEC|nr:uncharacterized protein LDX57_011927 [Aspergillus melleus]KAH8434287.1 hypothetical protein LDX57_011927 [Aspergillus melleus]
MSLESLASTIQAKSAQLAGIAKEHGFEATLDTSAELTSVAPLAVRNELIQAAKDLLYLASGPTDHVLGLAWSAADTSNIDLLTRFEVPQHVPLTSSISIPALSTATNLPEDILYRATRFAIANGVFTEPAPSEIAHSPASRALATTPHLRNIVHFGTEFLGNILMKIPEQMLIQRDGAGVGDKVPDTAFNLAYRTDQNLFDFFAGSKDLNRKYHEYLMGRVNTPLWSMDRLRAAWDWERLAGGTIVDVGGSSGHTALTIAPLAPTATFIVQDNNADALDMGRKLILSTGDAARQGQISFMKHNFFEEQPVAADAYIFRHILHDWNDADSLSIIKALVPALKEGSRVFISEGLLPDPPAKRLNTLTDKMIVIEDQFMLAAHNARERTVADFERIFNQASERFRLVGVTSGAQAGAFQSLLEFQFQ